MTSNKSKELLLEMKNIHIDGFSDERWHKILKGVDLTLHRGEILGLIGESGAGKSTMGKAAMGYTQPGCKIIKGEINFNNLSKIIIIPILVLYSFTFTVPCCCKTKPKFNYIKLID